MSGAERRRYMRVAKNFILTYFDKVDPTTKFEVTQLKNISMGGACFVTTREFPKGTEIGIELKTPYITDTTYLEGVVHESHPKVKGMLYETRLEFGNLDTQAEFLMAKLIKFFTDEDNTNE